MASWEGTFYLGIAALTVALTYQLLGLKNASIGIPFDYGGDALEVQAHVKTMMEHGWYDSTTALGAPWGRNTADYPFADNLHLLIMGVLGLFVNHYAVVLNLYYLAAFPLSAVTAAWFVRLVGGSRVVAALVGILYAFAPYHYFRGEYHLYLGAYYPVPLAAGLIYMVLAGQPIWLRRPDFGVRSPRRWLTKRNVATFSILAIMGTASTYYSLFTLLFLAFAGSVAVLRDRSRGNLVGTGIAGLLLIVIMLINQAHNFIYHYGKVPNYVALGRSPGETEIYAFKLASLLLPSGAHRVRALMDLRNTYDSTFPLPSEGPTLGAVAAIGFVFLIVMTFVASVWERGRPLGTRGSLFWTAQRRLAALAVFGFLCGTVGGFGSLFGLFISDSIRGWNRISIFISLFALTAVGLLIDRAMLSLGRARRLNSRPALKTGVILLLPAVVLLFGLWDQSGPMAERHFATVARSFNSDQHYVDEIQTRVPPQSMIFELPYLPYPEVPSVNKTLDYDPMRGYLHSTQLRWSYGAVKGRPKADWAVAVSTDTPRKMIAEVAAAGFTGISVDHNGYADKGMSLEAVLRADVGNVAPIVSPDGRFSFWDMRGYARKLRERDGSVSVQELGDHVLLHAVGYSKPDFKSSGISNSDKTPWPSKSSRAAIYLDNPRSRAQEVTVSFRLSSPTLATAARLVWPDGQIDSITLAKDGTPVSRNIALKPGRSTLIITFPRNAGANVARREDVRFAIAAFSLTDPVIERFVP